MPTPAERQALGFLAAIALLGAAVRLATSDAPPLPTARERTALETQMAAVDSAARPKGKGRARKPRKESPNAANSEPIVSPAPIPPEHPGPRPQAPLDVDLATQQELENLPFIGPALATRILEDRQKHGPFGSVEGLKRVHGIGNKLSERLRPLVTFTGAPRPQNAPPAGAVTRVGEHPWVPGGRPPRP